MDPVVLYQGCGLVQCHHKNIFQVHDCLDTLFPKETRNKVGIKQDVAPLETQDGTVQRITEKVCICSGYVHCKRWAVGPACFSAVTRSAIEGRE